MKKRTHGATIRVMATNCAVLLFTAAIAQAGPLLNYTFHNLNHPAGPAFSELLGIDDSELIPGYLGAASAFSPSSGFAMMFPLSLASDGLPGFTNGREGGNGLAGAAGTSAGFGGGRSTNQNGIVDGANDPNAAADGAATSRLRSAGDSTMADMADGIGTFNAHGYSPAYMYPGFGYSTLPVSFHLAMAAATGIGYGGNGSALPSNGSGNQGGTVSQGGTFSGTMGADSPRPVGTSLTLGSGGVGLGSYLATGASNDGANSNPVSGSWPTAGNPAAASSPATSGGGLGLTGRDGGGLPPSGSSGDDIAADDPSPAAAAVPEPDSLVLLSLGLGLVALGAIRRR